MSRPMGSMNKPKEKIAIAYQCKNCRHTEYLTIPKNMIKVSTPVTDCPIGLNYKCKYVVKYFHLQPTSMKTAIGLDGRKTLSFSLESPCCKAHSRGYQSFNISNPPSSSSFVYSCKKCKKIYNIMATYFAPGNGLKASIRSSWRDI